jgi:hypothetical protein
MKRPIPWYLFPLLSRPERVQESLDRIAAAGVVDRVPNLWQIALGVLRMQHRLLFRPSTVGAGRGLTVRPTLRARLLRNRAIRIPFLLAERAISPRRVTRHLLAAHHDNGEFAYDLQMLAVHPGWLERVRDAAREVIENDTPRSRWLRDLCVFEGYHESLLEAVQRAIAGDLNLSPAAANDPDVSFLAYLRWCAEQPSTAGETLALRRAGAWSVERGRLAQTEGPC